MHDAHLVIGLWREIDSSVSVSELLASLDEIAFH